MTGTQTPIKIGEVAPTALLESMVLDRAGAEVRLDSLIDGHPALLVLLRHFGCIGCTQQVTDLEPRLLELHQLGMRTIFVGNGDAEFIDEFVRRHNLKDKKVIIVTDPSLRVFQALSLARTFMSAWGPRALVGVLRAKGRGLSGYRGPGDTYQQGGAVIIDRDSIVRFFYRNAYLTDRADTNDLVEAAMRVLYRDSGSKKGLV